jgi:hypothetical protein
MLVLIIVAVVCFVAGVYSSSRWLPELADGPVGSVAFFVICGLSGAAIGLIGIHVDSVIRSLERSGLGGKSFDTLIVADGLASMLRDSGTVIGLALVAYLLAPKAPRESDQISSRTL